MAWLSRLLHSLSAASLQLGRTFLDVLTSRNVVVVSSVCGILYAGLWLIAFLQTNGLISTGLPVPVADQVIFSRSGGPMRPASSGPSAQQAPASEASSQAQEPATLVLQIESVSPAHLWVLDDHGGTIGTNPQTGLVRLQMADSTYSGRGTRPESIVIRGAAGTYRIQLSGQSSGSYDLQVRAFSGDNSDQAVKFGGVGEIFADSVLETVAQIGAKDDGSADLQVSPVQVLVSGAGPAPASATAEGPQPSPAGSEATAGSQEAALPAAVEPAPAAFNAPGPRIATAPPVVLRPQNQPRLPIPLPVPAINLAPATAAAD